MSKYAEQSVLLEDPNSSTAMIVGLVPTQARVLDVGCSSGYLGEALKRERLARVWGIELDASDAERARERGFEKVFTADLDTFAWHELDPYEFDVVVFADVLEHLKRPAEAVRGAVQHLTPEGVVIASIPNIAHLSIRIELMEGGFAYEKLGLLDDTHLKYFTRKTIEEMFGSAGLSVQRIDATLYDLPEDRVTERLRAIGLEATPEFWERMSGEDARAYQYIVVAGRNPAELIPPIQLREKAVMEHARLTAELARSAAEIAHLRARIDRFERIPFYRMARFVRNSVRGRQKTH